LFQTDDSRILIVHGFLMRSSSRRNGSTGRNQAPFAASGRAPEKCANRRFEINLGPITIVFDPAKAQARTACEPGRPVPRDARYHL